MTASPATDSASNAELIWQQCLFAFEEPTVDAGFGGLTRTWLDANSWFITCRVRLGGADLGAPPVAKMRWSQREVTMYDRRVCPNRGSPLGGAPPRALPSRCPCSKTHAWRSPGTTRARSIPSASTSTATVDSVAWTPIRERYHHEDPVVAILSTVCRGRCTSGPQRVVPRRNWRLGQGDLFVMGGACQHDFEHAVPKAAHVDGPRLSIMFRHNLADWQPPSSGTYNQV